MRKTNNYLIIKELEKSTRDTIRHFVDKSMELNPAKKCGSLFNLFHENMDQLGGLKINRI